MTYSGTLYEKEVGAGLVVESEKKKLCDPFCSPRHHISNIKLTNKQTNKQNKTFRTVEEYRWKRY